MEKSNPGKARDSRKNVQMKITRSTRELSFKMNTSLRNLNLRTLLLALALFAISCSKDDDVGDPSVCFEYTEGDLYADMGVNFNASCSQQAAAQYYAWDFGDGKVATGVEVSHIYDAAGKYTVKLAVSDGGS